MMSSRVWNSNRDSARNCRYPSLVGCHCSGAGSRHHPLLRRPRCIESGSAPAGMPDPQTGGRESRPSAAAMSVLPQAQMRRQRTDLEANSVVPQSSEFLNDC